MRLISKSDIQKLQVSSVMQNNKNFGKIFMFDGCEDTCWSSDEGVHQWIYVEFKKEKKICGFSIQFQGGFAAQKCKIELKKDESCSEIFYPENVNSVQNFKLKNTVISKHVKLVFEETTDFYGRIVVYSLDFDLL